MNFLERRALERAKRILNISPAETVLDFDVGTPFLEVLPKPMPYPLPGQRIDVVCTDAALYVHTGGHAARWTWRDWLFLRGEQTEHGPFLKGMTVDGETLQVHLGRGPRRAAAVAAAQLSKWEATLTPEERAERAQRLHEIEERKLAERRRQERIRRWRDVSQRPKATGYVVPRSGGDGIGGGDVVVMDNGLWFHDRTGSVRAIVPYQMLRQLNVESTDSGSRIVAATDLDDVERVVVDVSDVDSWQQMFQDHDPRA